MTVMKAVCKTPPTETGKKITTGEKITEADKTIKMTQGTKDSCGAYGTTMVNRIIAQARSKKEADDAIVAKFQSKRMLHPRLWLQSKKDWESFDEEKTIDLRHLGGQELSEEDLSKLREFAIASAYKPDSILFSGIDEDVLRCIPDSAGAKMST